METRGRIFSHDMFMLILLVLMPVFSIVSLVFAIIEIWSPQFMMAIFVVMLNTLFLSIYFSKLLRWFRKKRKECLS